MLRQVQRERAALAGGAAEADFAAQHPGDFTADRQPQARAAVLAAGRPVRLLERLEDDLLLFGRDADAGVANAEGEHRLGMVEPLVLRAPPPAHRRDLQRHTPALGELEGVGQQVLENLLEALGVGVDRPRKAGRHVHLEVELLALGDVAEGAIDVVVQVAERDVARVNDDRARFDLRQVEDVIDQHQQVVAR